MNVYVGKSPANHRSLEDIHATVRVPLKGWRRFLAFAGPAFMISIGYMDPGNWGADLQAGSQFGYRLLWVLMASNLMAVLLQCLAARLGVVTGRDLAQACREAYPRGMVVILWVLTEIAIAATDLAEVIGTIIGLKLLFGLPYVWGLLVAVADTFILLALQRRGVRILELVTLALIAVIGLSFIFELVLCRPDWSSALRGFVPALDSENTVGSLYVAIAMLGATVMPHNLYLHSALVQTRSYPQTTAGKKQACRFNLYDSLLALNGAFFINAAILILAAATFTHEVKTLPEAHHLLRDVWGTALASGLFAVALLASGQSSTLTGTLAGQVVMEGFVRFRLRPWARRLITRSVAILPAFLVISLAGGETAADRQETIAAAMGTLGTTGPLDTVALTAAGQSLWDVLPVDKRLLELIVLSQAILSFQLPFAIIPLVQFTSDRRRMGTFANPGWLKSLAWLCTVFVLGLNGILIWLQSSEWAEAVSSAGWSTTWIYGSIIPVVILLCGLLTWMLFCPVRYQPEAIHALPPMPSLKEVAHRRIGVAVEFEGGDEGVLAQAVAMARLHASELIALHVVEGTGASIYGAATGDQESRVDQDRMARLVDQLQDTGVKASGVLGYGSPAEELVRLANQEKLDLLILGTHGHGFLADLALGQTVSPVLHRLTIPVLVVPSMRQAPAAVAKT
jgi:manganese transport protein